MLNLDLFKALLILYCALQCNVLMASAEEPDLTTHDKSGKKSLELYEFCIPGAFFESVAASIHGQKVPMVLYAQQLAVMHRSLAREHAVLFVPKMRGYTKFGHLTCSRAALKQDHKKYGDRCSKHLCILNDCEFLKNLELHYPEISQYSVSNFLDDGEIIFSKGEGWEKIFEVVDGIESCEAVDDCYNLYLKRIGVEHEPILMRFIYVDHNKKSKKATKSGFLFFLK